MYETLPDIITRKEAQKLLRIGKNKILEYIKTGELPAHKIGKGYKITKKDLINFVEDMTVMKFYVVKKGRTPGIYNSWDECKEQTFGFPNAVFKSFNNYEEAETYMNEETIKESDGSEIDSLTVYAFTDGSFNQETGVFGYGGFLINGDEKFILQGKSDDEEMASMRNVAGELLGAQAAIQEAIDQGLPEITIFYDYLGIEMWATGDWKRNKQGTLDYYDCIQKAKESITIHFMKVKGHSNIEGNDEADRLAKEAVGILDSNTQT